MLIRASILLLALLSALSSRGQGQPAGKAGFPLCQDEGKSLLCQLNQATPTQMMSYIIRTGQGRLIVVDGGNAGDAPALLSGLKALWRGPGRPVVEAWFLTHLHSDHLDAFIEIMTKSGSEVAVRNVYAHVPPRAVLDSVKGAEKREVDRLEQALRALPEGLLHTVRTGEALRVDDLTFDILHVPDQAELANAINNSSLVFRMTAGGQTVLFTGDIGRETSARLVQRYGARLQSDIVQMAHHGQNGATREFYQAVRPRICLWPTPEWLWTNRDGKGKYQTLEVRRWMEELKVDRSIVSCFGTRCLALPYTLAMPWTPVPLLDHPGNVFVEGERVAAAVPPAFAGAARWEVRDAAGALVTGGVWTAAADRLDAGRLPVGWYRVNGLDASAKACAWTAAAVLRRLAAPAPANSPVCIDTANAWFTRTGTPEGDHRKMAAFASLAALAGVSGVRDRLTWGEVEPAAGTLSAATRYDASARVMRAAGLDVLQVFHGTPAWAQTPRLEDDGDAGKRFPRDLRDPYRFCAAMAGRFKGTVQAWEPWNEANIRAFGGQLIDEMCALQKASCLGFKAGDPALTVCWNVYAGSGSRLHTQGVVDNACWPYYDTYNNHSYSDVEQYGAEFATAREGACGRPLWISECGIHVRWDAEHGDLPDSEEVRQAQFVPKSYASSLFAGVSRHYYFILGNYCESQVQFGLLRHDLTPRRGYLALAAVGRLLAGAQPLGRLTNGTARVYAFRARPDGEARDVLVAWAETGAASAAVLPGLAAEAVYDLFGRAVAGGLPAELTPAPVFAVLPSGAAGKLALEKPLAVSPAPRRAARSPVVMQVLLPQAQALLDSQAYRVEPGAESVIPVAVYNFSEEAVSGTLKVGGLPKGWQVSLPDGRLRLRPMERQVLAVKALIAADAGRGALFGSPVTLRGAFGRAGEAVLSFRLACGPGALTPACESPVASALRAAAWDDNIVSGAKMTHEERDGRMVFTLEFGDQDPWGYPRLKLAAGERPPTGMDGLMAEVELLEGEGVLRVQFLEEGGSAYLCELPYDFKKGGKQNLTAFFDKAEWGGHSRPDADGRLAPSEIGGVMVGINARRNSRVRLAVGNVRWVRY